MRICVPIGMILLALASPVFAQTAPGGAGGGGPPLPNVVAPDSVGIDLLYGRRVETDSGISIGAAEAPALQLTEGSDGFGGTPLAGFHYWDGSYPSLSDFYVLGNRGEGNRYPDGTVRSLPDGMTKQGNTLVEGDGTRWNLTSAGGSTQPNVDSYLTTLVRPDGETLTYTWSGVPTKGDIRGLLRSIRSSAGYQLNLEWEPVANVTHNLKKVTLTNRRYAYCDPINGACTGTYAWPTLSWAYTAAGTVATTSGVRDVLYAPRRGGNQVGGTSLNPIREYTWPITSGAGVVRNYTGRASATSGYPRPLYYGRDFFASNNNPCVFASAIWKVQDAAGAWNYTFADDCGAGFANATRTDPLGRVASRNVGTFNDELGRSTVYSYIDQWGGTSSRRKVKSVTYAEGNQVIWEYSVAAQNLLSTMAIPKPGVGGPTLTWSKGYPSGCTVVTLIYCNKPSHEIDARGKRTDYTYDPVHGGVLTKTLPANDSGVRPQTRFTYQQYSARVLNASGLLVNEAPIWKLQSTSACRLKASCGGTADEVVTSYTYDDNLLTATVTVSAGDNSASSTVAKTYDHVGNLVLVDGPATGPSDTTRYVYDALRRLTATMGPDPDGAADPLPVPVSRTTYNGDGQPTLVETGSAADQSDSALAAMTVHRKLVTAYDLAGRKERESLVGGTVTESVTQYSYDPVGRLECTAVRMNKSAFASLPDSACSLGSQGAYGPDRITRNEYDWAGQLKTVQRAYGVTTANGFPATVQQNEAGYEYTDNGKPKAIIDANGNRSELRYDGLDRQSCWIFPSKSAAGALGGDCSNGDFESYDYDENGNRTTFRKRDGAILAFQYDGLNRITAKVVPARADLAAAQTRDVYYEHDLRGLQTKVRFDSLAGEGISHEYDSFGQVVSTTTTMGGTSRTLAYRYDAHGNRTRITHPPAVSDALYGLRTHFFDYHYDGLDRPIRLANLGGTVLTDWTYNAMGQVERIGRGVSLPSALGYDALSRPTAITHDLHGDTADLTLGFEHNPAGQITSKSSSNDAYASVSAYNVSRTYQANGLNQYTGTVSNGQPSASFQYDPNGNLVSDGTSTFVYDLENRLVSASGGRNVALTYDPLGRLFQISGNSGTLQLLYDGDALVAEYDGAQTRPRYYVHAPGRDVPVIWYEKGENGRRLYADHQGSIVAAARPSNLYLSINGYDSWGIPNAANQGRFGYTGQAWIAELGMWHYKARIYSPTLGRFLQTDPVGYEDQMNLYAYVGNDPMNLTDPDGERRFGWIIELLEEGERKMRSVASSRAAAEARRRGENVKVEGGRQAARQVERAAARNPNQVIRHSGHGLKGGGQGRPHFQTPGVRGHTFYDAGAFILGGIAAGAEVLDRLTNPFDGGGLSECQDRGACRNGEVIPREERNRSLPPPATDAAPKPRATRQTDDSCRVYGQNCH